MKMRYIIKIILIAGILTKDKYVYVIRLPSPPNIFWGLCHDKSQAFLQALTQLQTKETMENALSPEKHHFWEESIDFQFSPSILSLTE